MKKLSDGYHLCYFLDSQLPFYPPHPKHLAIRLSVVKSKLSTSAEYTQMHNIALSNANHTTSCCVGLDVDSLDASDST
jgi:hypothetical protein